MANHTGDALDARAQQRDASPMRQVAPTIVHEIVTRCGQLRSTPGTAQDDLAQAVQLACARWLAGFRASRGLSVARLSELAGVDPQQLLWIDLGLATAGMLTADQEGRLRALLFDAQEADRTTLEEIGDVALGKVRLADPRMLAWLLEDLELNIWQQADLETTYAAFFTPVDIVEDQKLRRLLRPVHLVLLEILLVGAKSSLELKREALDRLAGGRIRLDNAGYAAVIDLLVTQGLVEFLPDRQDEKADRPLRQLRLTTLGRRTIGLQRYLREREHDQPDYLQEFFLWLQRQLGVWRRGVP